MFIFEMGTSSTGKFIIEKDGGIGTWAMYL